MFVEDMKNTYSMIFFGLSVGAIYGYKLHLSPTLASKFEFESNLAS